MRDDWAPFYRWLEQRLFVPGRWAVIPDAPGAPSQLNDALLVDWPFGQRGAPLWHMNGSLERLGRLLDRFDRVCLGWIGEFDPALKAIRPEERAVGCDAYHARMEEVDRFLGNRWPELHMMRGVLVAPEYPFGSADATTLAQNGWRYDAPIGTDSDDPWRGRRAYRDRLEAGRVRGPLSGNRARSAGRRSASSLGPSHERGAVQLGLW